MGGTRPPSSSVAVDALAAEPGVTTPWTRVAAAGVIDLAAMKTDCVVMGASRQAALVATSIG